VNSLLIGQLKAYSRLPALLVLFSFPFLSIQTVSAKAKGKSASSSSSNSTSLSPEALGAKAFLEDLLAKRYSQELSTMIDHNSFSLGAQLELQDLPPQVPLIAPAPLPEKNALDLDPLSDMMLGSLDPDLLLKSYVGSQASPVDHPPAVQRLLSTFRIRSVTVSVGLKEDLAPQTKIEVEQWLTKRVTSEFGKSGKGSVTLISAPAKKHDDPGQKNYLELLDQFQGLAGQLALALAIVMGFLLWRGASGGVGADAGASGSRSAEDASDFRALQDAAAEVAADNAKANEKVRITEHEEILTATRDIDSLSKHLVELVPRLSTHFNDVVRNWCHMGDAGRLRLACFAEVAGRETGKLPIPIDAIQDVQRIFAKMPEVPILEKRDALQKAYWDLLSTLNLGSESLSQPFAYLDGANLNMVNRVLMGQNPKLRTVVSLYMNDEMRGRYIKGLSVKAKKEMLTSASELFEIRADELEEFDRSVLTRVDPPRGQEIVPLELSFNKVVSSLSILEKIAYLPDLKGDAIDEYKRSVPSIAFLSEWPDEKLKILFMGISADEMIGYLRVRPDLKERFLALTSMMVGEIASDELSRPDKSNQQDREKALEFLAQRLDDMVQQGDLSLTEIFGSSQPDVAHQQDESNTDELNETKNVA